MIKELDPDIGLRIASGSTSVGKFILLKIGFNNLVNVVIKLLSTNKDMAIIKVKIVGNKFILIFIPSFTPSIKVLKISTFLYMPYIIIINTTMGIK